MTDCILTYEQLWVLNFPWIHDIEPGEKAFLRIIKEIHSFTQDSFQFTEANDSRLTFVQKLNGNPMPKVGDVVFTFGKWNLNRGFATTTELYHYQKAIVKIVEVSCEDNPLNNPRPGDFWKTNQSHIFHIGEVTTNSVTIYRNGVVMILNRDNFKAFLRSNEAKFGGHND